MQNNLSCSVLKILLLNFWHFLNFLQLKNVCIFINRFKVVNVTKSWHMFAKYHILWHKVNMLYTFFYSSIQYFSI